MPEASTAGCGMRRRNFISNKMGTREELMKNMKHDCFISTILYLLDIWERKELIKPILLLTYGFHYNVNWKTVDDTIVFSYMKEEILKELNYCGILYQEETRLEIEESRKSPYINEQMVLIVDGYVCPWHQAYKTYHVDHYLVLKKITEDKMIVIDPFFDREEFELNNKFVLKKIIFRNVENQIDKLICKREIDKGEYINNIDLFCDNLFYISSQLIECDMKFEAIELLRDVKAILYSKYNLLEVIKNRIEIADKCKMLIKQWDRLLSRLIYISLTKKIQQETLNRIGKDIKNWERELISYL